MVERIAIPTRIQGALEYVGAGRWRLWLHTNDFVLGTYLDMYSDGRVDRVTLRADEGPEIVNIKP